MFEFSRVEEGVKKAEVFDRSFPRIRFQCSAQEFAIKKDAISERQETSDFPLEFSCNI